MKKPHFVFKELEEDFLRLTPEQQDTFSWLYDTFRPENPNSVIIAGVLLGVAMEHPDWTYWQVAAEGKKRSACVPPFPRI